MLKNNTKINPWVWALLSILPFMVLHYFHNIVPKGFSSTGFLQYDQAFYFALGREAFDKGRLFLSSNPVAIYPNNTALCFFLFPWLLGFGSAILNIDPGLLYMLLGIIMATIFARITFAIINFYLEDKKYIVPIFFISMWGGGIFALAAFIYNIYLNIDPFTYLIRFDLGDGWWLLSWGRNAVITSEVFYHALIAGVWLLILKKKWVLAFVFSIILAMSHLFSGVELFAILNSWAVISIILKLKDRPPYWFIISTMIVSLLFGAYWWFIIYPFSTIKNLAYELVNPFFDARLFLLAYLPLLILFFIQLYKSDKEYIYSRLFLISGLIATFGLAFHNLIMKSFQPLHFARGYQWFLLFLFSLPLINFIIKFIAKQKLFISIAVIILSFIIITSDNLAFISRYKKVAHSAGLYLPTNVIPIFNKMNKQKAKGILFTRYPTIGYLSAVYTGVTPYCCNIWWTPNGNQKFSRLKNWNIKQIDKPWFSNIKYILLYKSDFHMLKSLNPNIWQIYINENWALIQKIK